MGRFAFYSPQKTVQIHIGKENALGFSDEESLEIKGRFAEVISQLINTNQDWLEISKEDKTTYYSQMANDFHLAIQHLILFAIAEDRKKRKENENG